MNARRRKTIKKFVINRDGMICCYCDLQLSYDQITLEHIQPFSKNGTYNTTNLTVACSKCNRDRGNRPFFEYCVQKKLSPLKLLKYKNLYFSNLKIKILNIAKEDCLKNDSAIPLDLIKDACKILKTSLRDFAEYEEKLKVSFKNILPRNQIKFYFEKLIKIIESECA